MATQNAINKKTGQLTVDPGAAGDSFVQFNIATVAKFRIGGYDTDNSFRVSQGSALGTNDMMTISTTGEVNLPLQPTFSAYLSAQQANVTGNLTAYSYVCDTEVFDVGGNYATGTGVFTAPITGRYFLSAGAYLTGSVTIDRILVYIVTSNRTYRTVIYRNASAEGIWGNISVLVDMDASDTAYPQAYTYGNGADTSDLEPSTATEMKTFFAGYLAC